MSFPVVLVAVNARYSHASLGARFLLANMGPALREQTTFLEFNIKEDPAGMAARISACCPAVVGLGVYIWNRRVVEALLPLLRRDLPGIRIVLGGPEISHDADSVLGLAADSVIRGEGETLWLWICRELLAGRPVPRLPAISPPDLSVLVMPDADYADADLPHRNIYVEASRGCPLSCDFCLSSVESGVRHFPEEAVQGSLQRLLDRGCLAFRFVDRSFNLGGRRAERLLSFFLERLRPGLRLHFEMTPDGLRSPSLRDLLTRFPPGTLHLEAGIQSFDPTVLARIHRRCDVEAAAAGITWLVHTAGATVHADLIAGLPGETPEGFAAGFDRLYRLGPSEIQVGILKRLHGTPLVRHAEAFKMRFREDPPYDVLETSTMTAAELTAIHRFAAHWDRLVNRGHFPAAMAELLRDAPSPWRRFDDFSRRLAQTHGLYGVGLVELAHALFDDLTRDGGIPAETARALLRGDYHADGRRRRLPAFLRSHSHYGLGQPEG
jgi:radical SAM superfamily enzyme YgiQ (UPF0313 family)